MDDTVFIVDWPVGYCYCVILFIVVTGTLFNLLITVLMCTLCAVTSEAIFPIIIIIIVKSNGWHYLFLLFILMSTLVFGRVEGIDDDWWHCGNDRNCATLFY